MVKTLLGSDQGVKNPAVGAGKKSAAGEGNSGGQCHDVARDWRMVSTTASAATTQPNNTCPQAGIAIGCEK